MSFEGKAIIDATGMELKDVLDLAEDYFRSGMHRVTVNIDGDYVMTLDAHSDSGSNAFWRPGRRFSGKLKKLIEDNPEEIEKYEKGKKMRNVVNFFMQKLEPQVPYLDKKFAKDSIIWAVREAVGGLTPLGREF